MKLENGRAAGSFLVTNTDAKEIRVRATPRHFRLSPDGQIVSTEIDTSSLATWLKITPREFNVAGNAERQVRFAIIAPDTIRDGSYWGGIEFLPLPSRADSEEATSQVKAIAAIMVPVMADKGKPAHQWSLQEDSMRTMVTSRGVFLLTPIVNTGPGRISQTGHYEIRDLSGTLLRDGDTNRGSIFPYSQRNLQTAVPTDLPPGTYDYKVTYTSEADGSKLHGALRFTVPDKLPEPPVSRQP